MVYVVIFNLNIAIETVSFFSNDCMLGNKNIFSL